MNVLFVYSISEIQSPEKPLSQPEEINFGLSYISAVLKKHGHDTKLTLLSQALGEQNRERLDQIINEFKPKLICLNAISTQYPFVASQAAYIKNTYPGIFLIVGGPHVSLNPSKILDDAFDALCISEGEYATLELVEQLEKGQQPTGIANLWFKRNGEIEINQSRPFIDNLDDVPFPDREMWSAWIDEGTVSRHSILLGRGCPFNCTYCSNPAFRKLAEGRYVRFRSPANIMAEIKEIAGGLSAKKEIYLEVETFGADPSWACDLFAGLKKLNEELAEPLAYGANIRFTPGVDFNELFAACQAANFRFIQIGLESGSDRVRREIMKRYYANEDIIKTVKLARRYGLQVALYNMVGLPSETPEEFQETIDVNRECQPDWHITSIFYPYPGTDLYRLCREQNLITDNLGSAERIQSFLDMPQFSKKQIQKCFIWFDWNIYRGYKPWYKLLLKVGSNKLKTKPKLHYLLRNITSNKLLIKIKRKLRSSIF